jgi:hypothetical protein
MHDCAIWPFLLEDQLALERHGDEINQPYGALGE